MRYLTTWCLLVIACAQSGSGLPSSTPLDDLSYEEWEQYCSWATDLLGGPAEYSCGQFTVTVLPEDACVALMENMPCGATLGELEDCSLAMANDICDIAAPECIPVTDCARP